MEPIVFPLIPKQVTLSDFEWACYVKLCFQCLRCGLTIMDGVQALIFKAGRHPATSWANGQLILRKISKTGALDVRF